MLVKELSVGGQDPAGNDVAHIYFRVAPDSAVYLSGHRVMVQYADDADRAKAQITALSPLNGLRDEIASLMDGWYGEAHLDDKIAHYNARIANALDGALQGDLLGAEATLTQVRADVAKDRESVANFRYIITSAACALGIVVTSWLLLTGPVVKALYPALESGSTLWAAIGAGTLGAFYSIATRASNRSLVAGLRTRDNISDATLRIVIGAIGASMMLALQHSGFISGLLLSGVPPKGATDNTTAVFVIGFLAGFSERLVPDLLAKLNVDPAAKPALAAGAATASAHPVAMAAAATLADARKAGAPSSAPDDDEDDCLCDAPPGPGEAVTDDAELPAAQGGVQPVAAASVSTPQDQPQPLVAAAG